METFLVFLLNQFKLTFKKFLIKKTFDDIEEILCGCVLSGDASSRQVKNGKVSHVHLRDATGYQAQTQLSHIATVQPSPIGI